MTLLLEDFNSRRLKTARIFRGKSIEQIAEETEINKAHLSSFEEGRYLPREENVHNLAKALNFPTEFFFEKDEHKVIVDNKYKVKLGANRIEDVAHKEKLIMLHKIYLSFEEIVKLNKTNLPENKDRFKDVEDLAIKSRSIMHAGKGPITSMISLLENNGIIIADFNAENKGTITFSQKDNVDNEERYLISLGYDNSSIAKRNYSLAHELATIIGHNLGIPAKQMPKEEFAVAFLLPRDAFLNDLKRPEEIKAYINLKKKWLVPISAMILRAYILGRINYKQYSKLMKDYSTNKWNSQEPLENSLKDTTTPILRGILSSQLEKKKIDSEDIMDYIDDVGLSLYKADVEFLIGFKKGRLSN